MTHKWFTALTLTALGSFALTSCMPQATAPTRASQACLATPEALTSSQGVAFVRTPDACFQNLPDWNYEVKYLEIDGLRQAYYDIGPANGQPVLLLHGQPSWSYLYRYMIPELVKGGHRVIAMDHLGMGRSDKPVDLKYHSFQNHANRLSTFVQWLELKKLTVFMQDWGSVLGLYIASKQPDTFDRIILGNGGFPNIDKPYATPTDINATVASFGKLLGSIPPQQPDFYDAQGKSLVPLPAGSGDGASDPFADWVAYAMYAEDFKPSIMLEANTYRPLTPDQKAAYDAPFPSRTLMAAPRTFPSLLNQTVGLYKPVMEGLTRYNKPFMTIFGANELGLDPAIEQGYQKNIPGARGQDHHRFPDASHYLQDDKGKAIAERINKFIAKNPL